MTLLHQRTINPPLDDAARRIMFLFIGGGAQRATLEQEVRKRGLTNVQFHPYQPQERLAETLGVADLHLISLNPKLEGLIVPSKFYGIAAAARPTIFIGAGDGEIAQLIEQTACGFTVTPGDAKSLVDRILQLARDPELCRTMGARARAAFEARWDTRNAVKQWEEVLNAAAQPTQEQAVGVEPACD
jgi:glycosyltransferase involved in cell wall biosynthesis